MRLYYQEVEKKDNVAAAAIVATGDDDGEVEKKAPLRKAKLCMEPRDLELLEDAYFAGWVHKFAQNEVEFHRVLGEAMTKITLLGWKDTVLNEVHWW